MHGRLKDLTLNRDGTQNITVTIQEDARDLFDEYKDMDIDIEIKRHYRHRSMDSNNMAWALIDQIAAKTHLKKTEVYRNAIKDVGGVSEIVTMRNDAVDTFVKIWTQKGIGWQVEVAPSVLEGYSNLTVYYGSSVFSTSQMGAFIDSLIQDCEALNIPVLARSEIDKALALWAKKVEKSESVHSPK